MKLSLGHLCGPAWNCTPHFRVILLHDVAQHLSRSI